MSKDELLEWKFVQLVMLLADTGDEEQDEYNHFIGGLLKAELQEQYKMNDEEFSNKFLSIFHEYFVIEEQKETTKMN